MQPSSLGKFFVVLAALGALALYLVVVDFGLSAGRIHQGIKINRIDVGGMTREEAEEVLDGLAEQVDTEPVVFRLEGFEDRFELTPIELDWQPRIPRTINQALAVGRSDGLKAISDRVSAWLSPVRVQWRGTFDKDAISAVIDSWEKRALDHGVQIDRWRLRLKIRRSILVWPRRELRIPIES